MNWKSRPLSTFERYNWVATSGEKPIYVGALMRFEGHVEESKLRESIDLLQQRHYFLNVSIQNEPRPRFLLSPKKPIPFQTLEVQDDQEFLDAVHRKFHQNLKDSLFRVVHLSQGLERALLFVMHHSIADGLSIKGLMHEFFQILAGQAFPHPEHEPFVPEIEHADHSLFSNQNSRLVSAEQTGMIFDELSESETAYLIKLCRAHHTTVQGVLSAALLQAMSDQMRIDSPIRYECDVNLRSYFGGLPSATLGCLAASAFFKFKIESKGSVWDLAKDVKNSIHAELSDDFLKKVSRYVLNVSSQGKSNEELEQPLAGVSNLGKLAYPHRYDGLTLKSFHFMFSAHPSFYSKNSFYLTAVTFRSKLFLTFLYPKPWITDAFAHQVANTVLNHLRG